jgi:hypothetical protein
MSITSALIASTIDKIKKDLYQLEDWLNSLHPGPAPALEPSIKPFVDVSALMKRVEELTVEVSAQKHTIHHLVDRLDVMEETREIHIDGHLDEDLDNQQDPWLSDIPLQNEIVDPMFVIHKEEVQVKEEPVQVKEEPVQVKEEPVQVKEEPVQVKEEPVQVKEEPVQVKEEVVQEEEEEQMEEEEEETVQVQEVVKEEPLKEEEPVQEEEEEEEEVEEEGVELEEIIVKGVHYYKDPEEGFVYEIDSEGQPSENPIGVWKTKTQTISFYRST